MYTKCWCHSPLSTPSFVFSTHASHMLIESSLSSYIHLLSGPTTSLSLLPLLPDTKSPTLSCWWTGWCHLFCRELCHILQIKIYIFGRWKESFFLWCSKVRWLNYMWFEIRKKRWWIENCVALRTTAGSFMIPLWQEEKQIIFLISVLFVSSPSPSSLYFPLLFLSSYHLIVPSRWRDM